MPMMLEAMLDAGFETGVLFERCRPVISNISVPGICVYDEWEAGQSHGLSFVRIARVLRRADLIDAVAAFRPSIVLFVRDVASLMRSAAAYYAWVDTRRASWAEAASVLRCSLPAERFWEPTLVKSSVLRIAAQLGVRTPWSVAVPERLDPAALEAAARQVPVVIKSEKDGSGRGVTICRTVACARAALRRCTTPCGYSNCSACTRQQFVDGHTISFEASAVDGRLLGGFGRAEVLTRGQTGVARASVTLNAPEAAEAMRRLLAYLEYTGVAAADFVVEASTGHTYLIDPNLRMGMNLIADGSAIGLGASLLGRLRAALAEPTRPDRWPTYAPLGRSTTYGLFTPEVPIPAEIAYCPDVFLAVPWRFFEWVQRASKGSLIGSPATCEIAHSALPSRRLRQACGSSRAPCAGRCRALPTVPALSAADVASELCSASGDWARAHATCMATRPAPGPSGGYGPARTGARTFATATQWLATAAGAERYWLRQRTDPSWPIFTSTAFGRRHSLTASERLVGLPTIGTLCRGFAHARGAGGQR